MFPLFYYYFGTPGHNREQLNGGNKHMEQENMEVMEQEQTPVEEENGQVPAGDPADQPENEKTFT